MILIISTNEDETTNFVIQHLLYKKEKFLRLNQDDRLNVNFHGNEIVFSHHKLSFNLKQIKSIWYRKGVLNFEFDVNTNLSKLSNILIKEKDKIVEFLYYKIFQIKHLNSLLNSDNKLITLEIAQSIDIKTPNQYLFSSFLNYTFLIEDEKKITKLINGDPFLLFKNIGVYCYTNFIDIKYLKGKAFFPSLVQNYIEKKYELRVFFINDVFYTMAIFSQKNLNTKIDYRDYVKDVPNRRVPYKLPKEIEFKLSLLMSKINLNSGSIDMIVTPNNEYVFLEVNPVGQFGSLSYNCNYNVEKIIAKFLSDE